MRTVYDAANGVEAQIVADTLKGEGIEAVVTGAGLIGAAGELPAIGLVNVRVADVDAERALAIIRAWEAATPTADPGEPTAPPAPRPARRGPTFLAGIAIGALATYTVVHGWPTRIENTGHEERRVDRSLIEVGGRLVRVETDRDGDGRVDDVIRMGDADGDSVIAQDEDFDGVFEHETHVADYLLSAVSADRDGDGYFEYYANYHHGAMVEESWTDPVSHKLVLRTAHDGISATSSEIDSDGDGRLDTRRRYDRRGEIIATEAIQP